MGDVEVNGEIPCSYPFDFPFDDGENIIIEAIPRDGYHFAGWEGEPTINKRVNPLDVEVDRNMSLTATFAPDFYEYHADNGMITVAIPDGADAIDDDGLPVTDIDFSAMALPPAPPAQTAMVGNAFFLEPDGATFDPEATLHWKYIPEDIPDGARAEDLVIAYYEEWGNDWTLLKSKVDTDETMITADIDHLSLFAVLVPLPLVPTPPEAAFTTSALTISPTTTGRGGTVNISVNVTNNGGNAGTTEIILRLNDEVADSQSLTLQPDVSQTVNFETSLDVAGSYAVNINGLRGSFTIDSEPVTAAPVAPAEPDEATPPPTDPGETNTGGINWLILVPIIVAVFLAIFLPIKLKKRHYDW